jgi:signal transduction histidine kinase
MSAGGALTIETCLESITEEYCRTRPEAHPGATVRITVRDTGCGMDENTRRHIFEPFFTTKPQGKGTGLGLSIVYGIVKSSQGWIEVDSKPECGTAISIFLPQYRNGAGPASSQQEPAVLNGTETVLLV